MPRAENKKVVGALPKKIHLQISRVDQYVVKLVWVNTPGPIFPMFGHIASELAQGGFGRNDSPHVTQ